MLSRFFTVGAVFGQFLTVAHTRYGGDYLKIHILYDPGNLTYKAEECDGAPETSRKLSFHNFSFKLFFCA